MNRWILAVFASVLSASSAGAHSWYSEMSDPQYGGCCSGRDCAVWAIQPGQILPEGEGYRIRLTREQILLANPASTITHVDQYFPLERVLPSRDGNWHVCPKFHGQPDNALRCLIQPPNM